MRFEVATDDAGRRIDQVLASTPGVGSRSHAEKLLSNGSVSINGKKAAKSARVRGGDTVDIEAGALVEPPAATFDVPDLSAPFQDDHLIVIDKPTGMIVHPAPGFRGRTLVEVLTAAGVSLAPNIDAEFKRPGVVHRLDKDTSGVIVFAKTAEALRTMQESLRTRAMRREYIALVKGHVPSRAGRIEAPIGRDVRDATRQSIDSDSPKHAITHFVVNEVLPTTTLLRIRLETGRTHQIRVHMQAIGHPVVGDPTYGEGGEAFGLGRQFLHAAQVSFPHPVTGEPIEVTAPLPEELLAALAEARRAEA